MRRAKARERVRESVRQRAAIDPLLGEGILDKPHVDIDVDSDHIVADPG